MSSKFILIVSLFALLSASSAHAQGRKRGRGRGRSAPTESLTRVPSPPPSSLFDTPPAPVDTAPPPPPFTDSSPKPPAESATPASADSGPEGDAPRPRISLLPLVLAGVEPLWEGRVFRHTEFTQPNVRRYDARGYPSIALSAEVYPLVNVRSKFLRGFGITGHYARAFGFESSSARFGDADANAIPVDTSFTRYAAGLRYRIHTNPESQMPFVFAIAAGVSGWRFDFGPQLPRDPYLEVPTALYRMVRFGVDAGLEVRPVTFYAALTYLHAFSVVPPNPREIDLITYPYLLGAPGMGGEFRGAVGVRVIRWLELRLSVTYGILAFHLKSLEGRADSPARVLDSYLSAGLGPYVSF
jgi:hypothetical protein